MINKTRKQLVCRRGRLNNRAIKQCNLIIVLCSLIIVPWSLVTPVNAVGISVSPTKLILSGTTHKSISSTFTVSNPSRETVIYEVSNDGLLPLTITPTTFLLEPNKKAKVTVEYSPQGSETINSQTNLSILGRPLTVSPTQAASGVHIPVTISIGIVTGINTTKYDPLNVGIVIIDSILLIWLGYLVVKKSQKHKINKTPIQ